MKTSTLVSFNGGQKNQTGSMNKPVDASLNKQNKGSLQLLSEAFRALNKLH